MAAEWPPDAQFHPIGNLEPGACEKLVKQRLGVQRIPDELRQLLVEKTSGNPGFMLRILDTLVDAGLVKERDGHRSVDLKVLRDAQALLPDSLHAALMAGVDRLTEEPRQLLKVAAVVGERARREVLEQVFSAALPPAIHLARNAHLATLARAELLIEDGDALRFQSAGVRETVYESVPLAAAVKFIWLRSRHEFFRAKMAPPMAYHGWCHDDIGRCSTVGSGCCAEPLQIRMPREVRQRQERAGWIRPRRRSGGTALRLGTSCLRPGICRAGALKRDD